MSRGWGVVEALRDILPRWAPELFVFITQLGDVWFIFVIGALCYWFGDDREQFAFVIGAALGALALTLVLKESFALARPREALRFVEATGYGFPSGHALGSTVFWGALALSIDRWSRKRRFAGVAVIVTLVVLSRLVLGVHFVIDVVVGIAVGLAYLAFVVEGLDRRPTAVFGTAVVLASVAVLIVLLTSPVEGALVDSVAAFGGTAGAFLAWSVLDPPNESVNGVAATAGLLVLGTLSYAGLELSIPLVAVFAINAVVQGGIIVYPQIAGH